MLFRVENIPHRDRKLMGKCRACKRHSTFKVKLHRLQPCLKNTGKYEWVEREVLVKNTTPTPTPTKGKKSKKQPAKPQTKTVMKRQPIIEKEFRPIGNKPYLLCSRRCITLAQLAFL